MNSECPSSVFWRSRQTASRPSTSTLARPQARPSPPFVGRPRSHHTVGCASTEHRSVLHWTDLTPKLVIHCAAQHARLTMAEAALAATPLDASGEVRIERARARPASRTRRDVASVIATEALISSQAGEPARLGPARFSFGRACWTRRRAPSPNRPPSLRRGRPGLVRPGARLTSGFRLQLPR